MQMLLQETEYNLMAFGEIPDRPLHISVQPLSINEEFLGGSAILKHLQMQPEFENGITSLPFSVIIPKSHIPCPAIVIIVEEKEINDNAMEWVSKGYAVFYLCHSDISVNNGNFKSGISAYISPSRRKKSSAGKIAVWAWAAIRVLEYAEVLYEIDRNKIGIAGEGIFGLSAVLADKYCDNFSFVSPTNLPKIDKEFVLSNPHIFSPEFAKKPCFDNNN